MSNNICMVITDLSKFIHNYNIHLKEIKLRLKTFFNDLDNTNL